MKTKLSDRVRPNCEAAPWVIDEIKKKFGEISVSNLERVDEKIEFALPRELVN